MITLEAIRNEMCTLIIRSKCKGAIQGLDSVWDLSIFRIKGKSSCRWLEIVNLILIGHLNASQAESAAIRNFETKILSIGVLLDRNTSATSFLRAVWVLSALHKDCITRKICHIFGKLVFKEHYVWPLRRWTILRKLTFRYDPLFVGLKVWRIDTYGSSI